jgi:hypothetical protein
VVLGTRGGGGVEDAHCGFDGSATIGRVGDVGGAMGHEVRATDVYVSGGDDTTCGRA